jgi:hypothetical protein
MTLTSAIENVLNLQKHWTANKTTDMGNRGEIIRNTIPELLKPLAERYGLKAEGGSGIGKNNRVPWVRVFNPAFSPSPTGGWYAAFLFAADGSAVFLSLNQGTTDRSDGTTTRKVYRFS